MTAISFVVLASSKSRPSSTRITCSKRWKLEPQPCPRRHADGDNLHDYKDFGACNFRPRSRRTRRLPALELTVSEVKPNESVDIQVPDNVRQASVQVKTDKVADVCGT